MNFIAEMQILKRKTAILQVENASHDTHNLHGTKGNASLMADIAKQALKELT